MRQEIVDEIKSLTSAWVPAEVNENVLSRLPADKIKHKLGNMQASGDGPDLMAQALKFFSSALKPNHLRAAPLL